MIERTTRRRPVFRLRPCLGVELTPTHVRGVRLGGFAPVRTCEIAWDPSRPREAVEALRAALGSAGSLSLAVGLGFLHVKQLQLPPVAPAERARMVALEPDRYFAAGDSDLVVSLVDASNLAFAVPRELVESWLPIFEEWVAIERIEAAPLAVARELGGGARGLYEMDAGAGELGLVDLEDGRLRSARRMPRAKQQGEHGAPAGTTYEKVPVFTAALGTARGMDDSLDTLLAPDDFVARVASRRRWRLGLSVAGAAAALVVALWSADAWRARTLAALEARVPDARSGAEPANAALQRLLALEAEALTIRRLSDERADPYAGLAALGNALPRDAVVLSAKAAAEEWQIQGTARDASAIVPALDNEANLDSVHVLAASSRFRESGRSYETFSVAFRYRPRP